MATRRQQTITSRRTWSPPRRVFGRRILLVLGLLAIVFVILAGRWYLLRRSLSWQIERGLELLAGASTPTQVVGALDRWERETRPNWQERRRELVEYTFSHQPLKNRAVRLLLTRITDADYGQRRADWGRWFDNSGQLAEGKAPRVPRRDAVSLVPAWESPAPIGLTAWFTTIIAMDGQIYVASLGRAFDDQDDQDDGVVRVDGVTGESTFLFRPPPQHRGPRDVIGVAAGTDALFAACYNGSLYCLDRSGNVNWQTHVGSPVVAPPMAVDTNQDGVLDVTVITRTGKVVAVSGRTGNTIWVQTVAVDTAGEEMLGAALALGDCTGDGDGREILTSCPTGDLRILAARSGEVLWRQRLPAGLVAGPICHGTGTGAEPPAHLADRFARIWALEFTPGGLDAIWRQALAVRAEETVIAGVRTLNLGDRQPPLIVAAPTGSYGGSWGAVCALDEAGVRWRFPVDGAIWGAPAMADLNGNGTPELVVAGACPAGDALEGRLVVLSSEGHCVYRQALEAPVVCSPVIADVDADGYLEVLVADQLGQLHCFDTKGLGPVQWGTVGGDCHNTRNAALADTFGHVPSGFQWQWRPE